MTQPAKNVANSLSELPKTWRQGYFPTTAWDPTLKPSDHASLARERILAADQAFSHTASDGRIGCAWLTNNAWDTEFFGVRMAVMGIEGDISSDALAALLPEVVEQARANGVQHLRTSQRAGRPDVLRALQEHGFHVRWASVQITCDTRLLAPTKPLLPDGLEIVTATEAHIPALVEAAERVGPYCWPEFEPHLPLAARQHYVAQRLENCILSAYADTTVVALLRHRPVGLHASAQRSHGPALGATKTYAYVRETFVAPDTPPGLGGHMMRVALHKLRDQAPLVTGRVRLDGRAMLNTALNSGYTVTGDELLLSRSF